MLISVLMSTYKEPVEFINAAVRSILDQTYHDIEYVIMVDNPDNMVVIDYLLSIEDPRIQVHINEKNLGLVGSLNNGLRYCRGEYVARMDADDISYPMRLEKQLAYAIENDYDLVGGSFELFKDLHGEITEVYRFPQHTEECKKYLCQNSCVPHPTWLVRKEVYEICSGYREIITCEDYDFIIRAVMHGFKIGNVEDVILKYRYNLNSISRINQARQILTAKKLADAYKHGRILTMEEYQSFVASNEYKKKTNSITVYFETLKLLKTKKISLGIMRKVLCLFLNPYFYTDLKERALTRHMSTKKAFKDSDNERGNKL